MNAVLVAQVASSSRFRRLCAWLAGLLFALLLLIASMLTITLAAGPGGSPSMPLLTSQLLNDISIEQWLLMQQAAAGSGCGLDPSILAGLLKVETDFGRNPDMATPHDGGIIGLVQMQPGNWAVFARPGGDPFAPRDALPAAAKFLCAHGAGTDIRGALFAYNHADWYVNDVLSWAARYSALMNPSLSNVGSRPSAAPLSGGRQDVVRVAEGWKGVRYAWGGTSRSGIDCSGLVMVVFAQFGARLPHNAQLQYNAVAHIPDSQLEPGDLVFFAQTYPSSTEWITHVGIYIGNGLQINAPTEGQVVAIQPAFSGFWGAHYAGAGRVRLPGRSSDCPTCA